MPVMDTSCLKSAVKNVSGDTKYFGFLPPTGLSLEADEEVEFMGRVEDAIARSCDDGGTLRRKMKGLFASIEAGNLIITKQPNPIVEDTVTGDPRILVVNNGTVNDDDPCFNDSV